MHGPAPLVTPVPSILPGDFIHDPVHEPMWRQLGADRCRVVVVDLKTLDLLAWHWMREGGVSSGEGDAQPLDHILPGADTLLGHWVEHSATAPQAVIVHMLSPRRWVYFWRLDEQVGLLVQLHFLTGRSSSHEFDTAGVRVVCEHWLAAGPRAGNAEPAPAGVWDRVDRRRRAAASRLPQFVLACLLGCLLLGLWLASLGADAVADTGRAQQRELARLSRLSNSSLQMHLSHALAGGDYGEAQEVLSLHKSLDHFAAAAVTNARGVVVAHAGMVPPLPIGHLVPGELRVRALALPLATGSTTWGEALLIAAPGAGVEAAAQASGPWRAAGLVLTLLALLGAVLLWRHERRHDRPA